MKSDWFVKNRSKVGQKRTNVSWRMASTWWQEQNIFVQIAKFICSNIPNYLFKYQIKRNQTMLGRLFSCFALAAPKLTPWQTLCPHGRLCDWPKLWYPDSFALKMNHKCGKWWSCERYFPQLFEEYCVGGLNVASLPISPIYGWFQPIPMTEKNLLLIKEFLFLTPDPVWRVIWPWTAVQIGFKR